MGSSGQHSARSPGRIGVGFESVLSKSYALVASLLDVSVKLGLLGHGLGTASEGNKLSTLTHGTFIRNFLFSLSLSLCVSLSLSLSMRLSLSLSLPISLSLSLHLSLSLSLVGCP